MRLKEKSSAVGASFILAQLKNSPISFWIDSSGGPKELCNLSLYGIDPKYCIYGFLNEVYEIQSGETANWRTGVSCFDFLEEKINEEKGNKDGMFVGYFSYDLFQNRKSKIGNSLSYPDFFFAYFDKVIARKPEGLTKQSPYGYIKSLEDCFFANAPRNDKLSSNMTDSEYLEKVGQIKEEIKEGNVYQVNLTREYFTEQRATSNEQLELDLYLRLRGASPNPYGCFFKTPFLTILSSSPEEFLFIKDGYIRTRPIKGTLPGGVFSIDPKNQAENIMIVDLERNDLGKVCEIGSVKASKLLEIESYKHLNHVVSTVEGELRSDVRLKDIFQALFPSGSITGAPKISAMRIIDRLEPTRRGAYTGTFGYIKTDGTMNFNILIRTIFVHNSKISFNVGGGIVADSSPESELEEIKLKAKGMMSALCLSF